MKILKIRAVEGRALRWSRDPTSNGHIQMISITKFLNDLFSEHKIASSSLRSYSSGYSEASAETAPTVDRRRKATLWDRWEQPPPDVTLTLHRESAV